MWFQLLCSDFAFLGVIWISYAIPHTFLHPVLPTHLAGEEPSEHSAATGDSDFSGVGQLYDGASSGLEQHDDPDDADHSGNSDQEAEPVQVEENGESGGASDLEPLGPIRVLARGEAVWHSMFRNSLSAPQSQRHGC